MKTPSIKSPLALPDRAIVKLHRSRSGHHWLGISIDPNTMIIADLSHASEPTQSYIRHLGWEPIAATEARPL